MSFFDFRTATTALHTQPFHDFIRSELKSKKRCISREEALKFVSSDDRGNVVDLSELLLTQMLHILIEERHEFLVPDFDVSSVPPDMFWRKNVGKDWDRQCREGRFGWFSDSVSISHLLKCFRDNTPQTSDSFLDAIGLTKPYGEMYFLFFTKHQLETLVEKEGVVFFRPTWGRFLPYVKHKMETIDSNLIYDYPKQDWLAALEYYSEVVLKLGKEKREEVDDETLRLVLHESLKLTTNDESSHPRFHPFAAIRYFIDVEYGANKMFMGDGFTYSDEGKKGHAEFLVSSFMNYDVPRTKIHD
eukprot:PhM_4_TR15236/c0_g1_i1/m.105019